jgi:anti-sigma factor RsiW
MSNEKMIDLMNRDIDGAISPAEQAELRAYLASSPEARRQYDELVKLNSHFRGVSRVEAPSDLKPSIMFNISAQQAASSKHQHGGYLKKYARWFVPSPSSYVVSGAMAGALVMMLALNIFQGERSDRVDRFRGTMAPAKQESAKIVDQQTLQAGDASAEVACERTGQVVTVAMDLSTPTGMTVTLAFDPQQFAVSGMSTDSSTLRELQTSDGLIKFSSDGTQSVRFLFRADSAAAGRIRVAITQNGVTAAREVSTRTSSVLE